MLYKKKYPRLHEKNVEPHKKIDGDVKSTSTMGDVEDVGRWGYAHMSETAKGEKNDSTSSRGLTIISRPLCNPLPLQI